MSDTPSSESSDAVSSVLTVANAVVGVVAMLYAFEAWHYKSEREFVELAGLAFVALQALLRKR